MPHFSAEDIRRRFSTSTDFNEIFDAFEDALAQRIDDIEVYRLLFWNHSLSPDELCLFGEKLAQVFPPMAYDVYMWLANVFEVTYAMYDNYELAVEYYRKAAVVRPQEPDPYLDAADCYEPDLNIPPLDVLIDFLKEALEHVSNARSVCQKLSVFYQTAGDLELSEYYRKKSEEFNAPPTPGRPPPLSATGETPAGEDETPPSPS